MAETLSEYTISGEKIRTQNILTNIVTQNKNVSYAYIVDFNGEIFTHTFSGAFPSAFRPVIDKISTEELSISQVNLNQQLIQDVAYPLIKGLPASIHLGLNQNSIDALYTKIYEGQLIIFLISCLIAFVLAFVFTDKILKPLLVLVHYMSEYAKGNRKDTVPSSNKGELKQAIEAFNNVVESRNHIEF